MHQDTAAHACGVGIPLQSGLWPASAATGGPQLPRQRPEVAPEAAGPSTHSRLVHHLSTAEHPRAARRFPSKEMPANIAYQLITDHRQLDSNPRMNLASFVTTWMEPEARPTCMLPRPALLSAGLSVRWQIAQLSDQLSTLLRSLQWTSAACSANGKAQHALRGPGQPASVQDKDKRICRASLADRLLGPGVTALPICD